MTQATRWWCVGLFTLGAMFIAFAGANLAQDQKKAHEKHDESTLNHSLRDVINVGAKMFNEQGDHAGCYRLYQGSLLSVRPFLASDLQKKIDEGMSSAERMASYADRAFELRRVLNEVRASTKPGEKEEAKKDKKDKKKKEASSTDKGQVAGTLRFEGKAVKGGYFVTLVGTDAKKFSSAIQKDGTFKFATPIPAGEYRIAIEPITGEKDKGPSLPARYGSEEKSGLSIRVHAGKQDVDLNLLK